jgi:hypothetical protein
MIRKFIDTYFGCSEKYNFKFLSDFRQKFDKIRSERHVNALVLCNF